MVVKKWLKAKYSELQYCVTTGDEIASDPLSSAPIFDGFVLINF
jgi:hypothetical protein